MSRVKSSAKFMAALMIMMGVSTTHANTIYEQSVDVSELVSVYDGDTIKVNIAGWPHIIGRAINVRVHGVDTPEIRSYKCLEEKNLGEQAKHFTFDFVSSGKITLHNLQRDKYFRILADVKVDGVPLSRRLIEAGLAFEYYGGTKQSWCNG
ncbi:thermonuclease family protein [Pseudoalteromonas umbrosa]|uniref:thermonuclease family protein n=1 Tax=Pseudoalteromonas umbrosa TaxID=3048489 RepID=UPI0024C2A6D6|nr:thermonuclease family protein [Pseudoalteromonas sp. B95]MDK1290170.1 thermonuclease family protein [Pseudoalteromonas sp. B95]